MLIDKALRCVGVGVYDQGGAMDPFGALRFGCHFMDWTGCGLGADQRRENDKHGSEQDSGTHRLGMSLQRESREEGAETREEGLPEFIERKSQIFARFKRR